MKNLIETVEKFLTYSDEKLEELAKKNQALREETSRQKSKQEEKMKKLLAIMLMFVFSTPIFVPAT